MTREEIYEHLAQVYLGKKNSAKKKKKQKFDKRFFLQLTIMTIVLSSVFSGLTAFLSRKATGPENSIIFALNHSPIRIKYNLNRPFPPMTSFSIHVPAVNASKYHRINFSIRGLEEGYPGVVKIVLRNKKNETASYFVRGVKLKWQRVSILTKEFKQISDWTNLEDISFVLESWNAEKKKGIVLIDDVSFSS